MDDFDPRQDALNAMGFDLTRAAPVEPAAAYRGLAGQLYEFHSALRAAGFDQVSADHLTGAWLDSLMNPHHQ